MLPLSKPFLYNSWVHRTNFMVSSIDWKQNVGVGYHVCDICRLLKQQRNNLRKIVSWALSFFNSQESYDYLTFFEPSIKVTILLVLRTLSRLINLACFIMVQNHLLMSKRNEFICFYFIEQVLCTCSFHIFLNIIWIIFLTLLFK